MATNNLTYDVTDPKVTDILTQDTDSLKTLQIQAIITKSITDKARAEATAKIIKINKENYPEVAKPKIAEINAKVAEDRKATWKGFREEKAQPFFEKKKKEVSEKIFTPSSAENKNLLESIKGCTDLSPCIINKFAEKFINDGDLYSFLQLQSTAINSGIRIMTPHSMDVEQITEDLDNASAFVDSVIDDMIQDGKPSYDHGVFFITNKNEPDLIFEPKYAAWVNRLDAKQETESVPKSEKVALNPLEESIVGTYMNGYEGQAAMSADTIAHVRKVIESHPEIEPLMKHTRYAGAVDTVKLAQKKEAESKAKEGAAAKSQNTGEYTSYQEV